MAEGDPTASSLEACIGYSFADKDLLLRSLTHPSFKGDKGKRNYQRLEFLGDAVLGMVLAEELFKTLPDEQEGTLTRYRSMLVKGKQLYLLAEEIELGKHLRLGEAEAAQGGRARHSILEDAFEALIGAVYLDGGLTAAREVALKLYGSLDKRLELQDRMHNPKGKLQELLQPTLGNNAIEYKVLEVSGPDHKKHFTVEVWISEICRGQGSGSSKKIAEEAAARKALEEFQLRPQ
jgi:ribonuclease-3